MAALSEAAFSIIDVGSGAGFPALALAIARPRWRIVSLEATEKKVRFQQRVCEALGLNNVQTLHGRAESAAHEATLRERFNAATARAVAPLNVLAELTMAFVRPGGTGLFWKGPHASTELSAAAGAFKTMGAATQRLRTYVLTDIADTAFCLAIAEKQTPAPGAYPRRNFGAIKNRPLA